MEDQQSDQYLENPFDFSVSTFLLIKQDQKQNDNNSGKERKYLGDINYRCMIKQDGDKLAA